VQKDPIVEGRVLEAYVYAANTPVRAVDPSGKQSDDVSPYERDLLKNRFQLLGDTSVLLAEGGGPATAGWR
jgi:hypothetical protein